MAIRLKLSALVVLTSCRIAWANHDTGASFLAQTADIIRRQPLVADTTPFSSWCSLSSDVDGAMAYNITLTNCLKVRRARDQFSKIIVLNGNDASFQSFTERIDDAMDMCSCSESTPYSRACAEKSIVAWGEKVLQGRECCNSPHPPYCLTPGKIGHWLPFALVLGLCFTVLWFKYFCSSVSVPRYCYVRSRRPSSNSTQAKAPVHGVENVLPDPDKLLETWKESSLYKALQGRETDFDTLFQPQGPFCTFCAYFGFQADSCQNQVEHFVSLWRSHVSVVADRELGDITAKTKEDREKKIKVEHLAKIYNDALDELCLDWLDGFHEWRNKFRNAGWLGAEDREVKDERELLAMFLLIWGEAGNLRFMPELLYFLTELAYAASAKVQKANKNAFLIRVVRPIYNVIFDENSKQVDGKDKRDLRDDCEQYMPADCQNYDDWNELFNDPERMKEELVLKKEDGGGRLVETRHAERFQKLSEMKIDWATSLAKCKTHREIHSSLGAFAATHRAWFLHAFLYLLTMWYVNEPWTWQLSSRSGGNMLLAGSSASTSFASVLFLVPTHAFFWKLSRWFTSGVAIREKKRRRCCNCFTGFVGHLFAWSIPVITYVALRYLEYTGERPDSLLFFGVLIADYVVSIIGALWILIRPAHAEDILYSATRISFRVKLVRWSFWIIVFTVKCFFAIVTVGGINNACIQLHIARPGQQTLNDFLEFMFTPPWDKDVLQWFALFGTGFFIFCADTQFWVVLGATILGALTAIMQRRGQWCSSCYLWRFCFKEEDRVVSMISKIPLRMKRWIFPQAGDGNDVTVKDENKAHADMGAVWDRIVRFMYEEDKITPSLKAEISYIPDRKHRELEAEDGRNKNKSHLRDPVQNATAVDYLRPAMFQDYANSSTKHKAFSNEEVKWRISAISRALAMEMPLPYQAPFIPGLTVLSPHYGEAILPDWLTLYKRAANFSIRHDEVRNIKFPPKKLQDASRNGLTPWQAFEKYLEDLERHTGKDDIRKKCRLKFRNVQGMPEETGWHAPGLAPGLAPGEYSSGIEGDRTAVGQPAVLRDLEEAWNKGMIALATQKAKDKDDAAFLKDVYVFLEYDPEADETNKNMGEGGRENVQQSKHEVVDLITWVTMRYSDEFTNFQNRLAKGNNDWNIYGDNFEGYNHHQWDDIALWAAMRSQTVYRTLAGMCLYHQALDCHWELQGYQRNVPNGIKFSDEDVWDASELFTCLVTMQIYPKLGDYQTWCANKMLETFPKSFKIAFLDFEDKGANGDKDNIHPKIKNRYFSCVTDKTVKEWREGDKTKPEQYRKRKARLKIELPGFTILGDGKGDNQNHAVPFTRGSIIQCIDANQGAYFEQMLLLPCVLGEFRREGGGLARKIVGFPEHITSDIGSVGEFAAGAELAFGTTLQRAYRVLGARMHYGHPDMMNKAFMIQQGGVSKAVKTIHLSEDIFAGMDFTLRGGEREIHHAEYFYVSKGRDLGFGTVLTFFAKLASGTGEQVLTRQMLRLGHVMGLGEFLGFYYAHAGFYLGQHLLSKCVPLFTTIWLLVVLDDPEGTEFLRVDVSMLAFTGAEVMAALLSKAFSWILLLFILAQIAPLAMEVAIQQENMVVGIGHASVRVAKQLLTLAPLHFIFQAKIIGVYITSEIIYGGAGYAATGRGLPLDRQPFVRSEPEKEGTYQNWAQHAFYDGFRLMCFWWLAAWFGGMFNVKVDEDGMRGLLLWWIVASQMTIISWLYAPFIFNPYQFDHRFFFSDWRELRRFFFHDRGKAWIKWHDLKLRPPQLKQSAGDSGCCGCCYCPIETERDFAKFPWRPLRTSVPVILSWAITIGFWYTVLNSKMYLLVSFTSHAKLESIFALIPPVGSSLIFALVLCPFLRCCFRERDLHLAFVACVVVVLDLAEAIYSLRLILQVGWWKTLVAGMVLKYTMLAFALLCAECLLRLKICEESENRCCHHIQYCAHVHLKTWLLAHRLAFDILVSNFIFWTLSPLFLIDYLRNCCIPGYTLHNLLIYRSAGHLPRLKVDAIMAPPFGANHRSEPPESRGHETEMPVRRKPFNRFGSFSRR